MCENSDSGLGFGGGGKSGRWSCLPAVVDVGYSSLLKLALLFQVHTYKSRECVHPLQ